MADDADTTDEYTRIIDALKMERRNGKFRDKYRDNPEFRQEMLTRNKEWIKNNKERVKSIKRESTIKIKYGITLQDLEDMKDKQKGRCGCCGEAKDLVIDHCHETNNVRELLCRRCNAGLGYIEDKPWLKLALRYEEKWDTQFASK